ncbi:hypothetical protein AJ79_08769 [Helicocarpus griseus UAMH5409]|uniref:Septation initiation network scaffold protein cdc11 n=1 Tax=Helicocarpus griseus UAMH5409 TaxID=1447875 RepID=A0A2B7WQA5_9EURO|nr:hypothetical protein AJ79_08769 [Helicocarpus griseus UAMH5409]
MSNNQPWLEDLSTDWIPQPGPGSFHSSWRNRISSLSNSLRRSRSRSASPPTSVSSHKPSFSLRHMRKTSEPSRLSDLESNSNISSNHSFSMINVFTSSAGKKVSVQVQKPEPTVESSTMQIRPQSKHAAGDTPEWKKRLVRGEAPMGEGGDLFGPMELENVFKPPRNTEPSAQTNLFASVQADQPWPLPSADKISDSSPNRSSGHQSEHTESEGRYNTSLDEAKFWINGSLPGGSSFDPRSRTVSGREELRNEEITPILFSKDETAGECTNQEFLGSIFDQLKESRLKDDLSNSRRRGSTATDDETYLSRRDDQAFTAAEDTIEMTSQSLPEDLSVGTMDFASAGGFVNMRRGGYSNDGSFRRRQLTPTSIISPLHSSSFLSNSKIRSPAPVDRRKRLFSSQKPLSPQFLTPDRARRETNDSRPRSSGSPLKLFGEYDTFTNNKLLRRMSQFEETFENWPDEAPLSPTETRQRGASRSRSRPSSRHNQATTSSSQNCRQTPRSRGEYRASSNDRLGANVRYSSEQRNEGLSLLAAPSLVITSEDGKRPSELRSQRRNLGQTGNRDQPEIHTDPIVDGSGHTQANASPAIQRKMSASANDVSYNEPSESNMFRQSETKRVLNSPTKDPSRKRRRTLQNIDPNNQVLPSSLLESTQFSASYNNQNNQMDGHHRVETKGEQNNLDVPRRSRTPTISHRRTHSGDNEDNQGTSQPNNIPRITLNINHSWQKPENKLSFVASPSHVLDESRKGSITTQDFLNEATKIMNIIRARGGNNNGLSSVEESEQLSDASNADGYDEESTQEEFSRPPSREGVDLRKLREPREQNPRIVSHLKKFEDKDDFELYMGGSVMSLHLGREQNVATYAIHKQDGDDEHAVESSPKNIRIRERHIWTKNGNSSSDLPGDSDRHGADFHRQLSSQGSSATTDSSRGSSSGSGAKGIIPSDMISHLIPEQVGAMTYNRSAHIWVKGEAAHSHERRGSRSEDDLSEEDPFKDIPDLSVDELQELMAAQTFSSPATSKGKLNSITATFGEQDSKREQKHEEPPPAPEFRPSTRDGRFESSSVQSKSSRFTSSCPKPETRATSWGSDELAQLPAQPAGPDTANLFKRVDDMKRQSGKGDGRQNDDVSDSERGRVATISFSSPLVSHVAYQEESLSPVDEQPIPFALPQGNSNSHHASDCQSHSSALPRPYNHSSPFRISSRQNSSFDGRAFRPRPISRIDEQNEDSAVDELYTHNRSLSVVQAPNYEDRSLILPNDPVMNTSYSFQLAPLSDFTLHQIDESMRLEVSYVAERTHPTSLRQVHGTFALATEDLIKHITDTEPYEPYWEHLRHLNLVGKGLITLHRLNEFCSRLEELDASNNNVGQLSGVPSSVRSLKIPRNYLSSLTSWSHLSNIQYLDVSGNQLEDLDALSGLVHLRSLKADGNKIRNIRGIMGLNGLLTLKLRDNMVSSVDFTDSELTRLINLDLRGNRLSSVRNIGFIKTIEKLDLRGNCIQHFESSEALHCLHSLNLSDNSLEQLDIRNFPNLQAVYADRNHLSTVTGLGECYYLNKLSLREQTQAPSSQQTNPGRLPIVHLDIGSSLSLRKLYLSSNQLSPTVLSPSSSVPSLQFLDMASCALSTLPPAFGTSFPNLRMLNLNFNALSDVAELQGITRLGRVSLVGNRISRLRRLCQVLRSVGGRCGALTDVDIRGNPVTVGFYPELVTGSGRVWRDEKGALVGGGVETRKKKCKDGKGRRQLQVRDNEDENEEDAGLPTIGGGADIASRGFGELKVAGYGGGGDDDGNVGEVEIEIDDRYTVPPANVIADRRYAVHLDEATKLRRRVVELMVQAAGGGRVKVLNGLPLALEERGCDGKGSGKTMKIRKDEVWRRLEELGVLKKKKKKKGEVEEEDDGEI